MLGKQTSRICSRPNRSYSRSYVLSNKRLFSTQSNIVKKWLIGWGTNNFGGLGKTDYKLKFQAYPERIGFPSIETGLTTITRTPFIFNDKCEEEEFADVSDIASNWLLNFAVTPTGQVFEWGFGGRMRNILSAINIRKGYPWLYKLSQLLHSLSPRKPAPRRILMFGAQSISQLVEEAAIGGISLDPHDVNLDDYHIVKMYTSSYSMAALSKTGKLFTWSTDGSDEYGVCARGLSNIFSTTPQMVPLDFKVKAVAMGFNHIGILTEEGRVMFAGYPRSGALGFNQEFFDSQYKPMGVFHFSDLETNLRSFIDDTKSTVANSDLKSSKVENMKPLNVKQASVVLKKVKNNLSNPNLTYGHGSNGLDFSPQHPLERLRPNLPKFTHISCGMNHTVLIDEYGHLWTMGRNAHGECGHLVVNSADDIADFDASAGVNVDSTPVDFRTFYMPTRLIAPELFKVRAAKVTCGLHHTVVLATNGEIYTFGANKYGQCARIHEKANTKHSKSKLKPWSLPFGRVPISAKVLNNARVVDIFAGMYETVLKLSDGRALAFGSYISDGGVVRNVYSMAEFDQPEDKIVNNASRHLIQRIPIKDLAPPFYYIDAQKTTYPEPGVFYQPHFSLDKMVFGYEHIIAIATPRHISKPTKPTNL